MSRIGKQPVQIPAGVTVEISGNTIRVKGPKGELKREIHPNITAAVEGDKIIVKRKSDSKFDKSLHGLFRNLIRNMTEGVSKGYEKRLEIVGVGFRFKAAGDKLTLNLGFSHPVEHKAPQGITFEEDKENKGAFIIKGIDKEIVGHVAAVVRGYKPPEPYKGKGIRYLGEYVPKKAGKTAASAAGGGATA